MSVVALRLAGPLQSWGLDSRFVRRTTHAEPTKSGVLGLVAAAKGLRRTDPLEELLTLRMGARVDQPGTLVRDFQTAVRRVPGKKPESMPLSYRYYQGDAVYLAVLEGDAALVAGIDEALRRPGFPLYLGRRSCPPAGPVALGVFDLSLEEALETLPWRASKRAQQRRVERTVRLATVRDAKVNPDGTVDEADKPRLENQRDLPVSFDPHHRAYTWRAVVRGAVDIPNSHGTVDASIEHDPMSAMGG